MLYSFFSLLVDLVASFSFFFLCKSGLAHHPQREHLIVKPSDDEGKLTERDDPSPPSFPSCFLFTY